jgi:hypothetical protein
MQDHEIRAKFKPEAPDGYFPLNAAARKLGCPARQSATKSEPANATPSASSTASAHPAHGRQHRLRHAVLSRIRAAFAIATDECSKSAESMAV